MMDEIPIWYARCYGKAVLNKQDFVRRFLQNEFGNRAPSWDTIGDYEQWYINNRAPVKVHLRNREAGGETYYNLETFEALCKWAGMANRSLWYCSAMAPTQETIIQGEVQRGLWGLDLYYSTWLAPMREALQLQGVHANGVQALRLLQTTMNELSYEWLQHLLDTYPDHVVEFSTYGCEWGTVPGHNTVFWECRLY